MPKASPQLRSFNGGEWSVIMEGRTDLDKYPASMRRLYNSVALPQGPAIRRSGTEWTAAVYDKGKHSALVGFVFSEEQTNALEFADFRMRILSEAGLQTYAPVAATEVLTLSPMKIRAPGHGAAVGDQVFLSGFLPSWIINNHVANVTAVDTTDITLDVVYTGATGVIANAYVSRVYHITTPYAEADVRNMRYLQSVDVVYLYCPGYRNYKLSRYGAYDWRLEAIIYNDGPYMPIDDTGVRVTINDTGNPVPKMTTNTTPSGIAFATQSPTLAFRAFDGSDSTFWEGNTQIGTLGYQFPSPVVVNGYTIFIPSDQSNADVTYSAVDRAPGTWKFYGNTSTTDENTWILLDAQTNYVLYDNNRSVWFKINNSTAYIRYRLVITACRRNGTVSPRISTLLFSTAVQPSITCTFSSAAPINGGEGFKTTDVDRLIRVKGTTDATWRQLRITARTSATVVVCSLLSEPFVDLEPKLSWRIGYFSDTTGWPICASFFEDRLAVAGPELFPDLVAISRTGAYTDMQQTTAADVVLDDNAVVFRINARKLSRIRWLAEDERGLLGGSGAQEFVIVPADKDTPLTARNIRRRVSTERGAAQIEPAKVDRQVLFVQASKRTVREFAYVFEADGYKTPSMSLFAPHLGQNRFAEIRYAAEPHSILWLRTEAGDLVGLTYNREENVIGWHGHNVGGEIEHMAVIPSPMDQVDALWLVVKRTINGNVSRHIERLTRFWDFGMTLDDACFADCCLRYVGAPTKTIYGLSHIEGATVGGLIDGIKYRDIVVTDGKIELPSEGSNITVGILYTSEAETSRIDAGAADGTAQGKTKRTHKLKAHMWESYGGEFGVFNEDTQEFDYSPVEYADLFDDETAPSLQTDMFPIDMPLGYGVRGTLAFRQSDPYPFNVVSIMPQLFTQDA